MKTETNYCVTPAQPELANIEVWSFDPPSEWEREMTRISRELVQIYSDKIWNGLRLRFEHDLSMSDAWDFLGSRPQLFTASA